MVLGSDSNCISLPLWIKNHRSINVKLFGVEIDSQLKLDKQIRDICSKLNRKAFILSWPFYLFNPDFKSILFKLFIFPNFDYCSTLFYFNNCSILSKFYIKNFKLFLNLDIHNNDDLSMQLSVFNHLNILPLKLWFFTHYCTFLHSLFFNQVCSPLINLFFKPLWNLEGLFFSLIILKNVVVWTHYYSCVRNFLIQLFTLVSTAFNEYLSSYCVYYFNMNKNAL